MFKRTPKLTNLALELIPSVKRESSSPSPFKLISMSMPELTYLKLTGLESINDNFIAEISELQKLKSIRLESSNISVDGLIYLLQNNKILRNITILNELYMERR